MTHHAQQAEFIKPFLTQKLSKNYTVVFDLPSSRLLSPRFLPYILISFESVLTSWHTGLLLNLIVSYFLPGFDYLDVALAMVLNCVIANLLVLLYEKTGKKTLMFTLVFVINKILLFSSGIYLWIPALIPLFLLGMIRGLRNNPVLISPVNLSSYFPPDRPPEFPLRSCKSQMKLPIILEEHIPLVLGGIVSDYLYESIPPKSLKIILRGGHLNSLLENRNSLWMNGGWINLETGWHYMGCVSMEFIRGCFEISQDAEKDLLDEDGIEAIHAMRMLKMMI